MAWGEMKGGKHGMGKSATRSNAAPPAQSAHVATREPAGLGRRRTHAGQDAQQPRPAHSFGSRLETLHGGLQYQRAARHRKRTESLETCDEQPGPTCWVVPRRAGCRRAARHRGWAWRSAASTPGGHIRARAQSQRQRARRPGLLVPGPRVPLVPRPAPAGSRDARVKLYRPLKL